jgi:hypothetical protein
MSAPPASGFGQMPRRLAAQVLVTELARDLLLSGGEEVSTMRGDGLPVRLGSELLSCYR